MSHRRYLSALLFCASAADARPPRPIVPDMVRLPAGQFTMGSDPAETDAVHYPAEYAAREQPARVVTIVRPFAIARTEVTRAAFARFVTATGWKPDGPCSWLADAQKKTWVPDAAHHWLNPGFAQTGRHPVVCVNLADAEAYARWLSARTGRAFRLPSSAEWEYAARAGTRTTFWWGDTAGAALCRNANIAGQERARADGRDGSDRASYATCNDGHAFTATVGSYRPNPWGLYDMLGNVWEWTRDCLNPDQRGAPGDANPRKTGDCASHIDRGASWTNSPKYVRLAAQHPDLIGARTVVLGFRLVEDLQ